jgi:antitoxin component of MazEF toxin-antitoxin module
MARKVFRTGNSMVVSLPREALDFLGLQAGAEIELNLDRENQQVTIRPLEKARPYSGIDEIFARQISEFIEQYRPTLEQLSE